MYVIWVLVKSVAIEECLGKVRFILADFKRQLELSAPFFALLYQAYRNNTTTTKPNPTPPPQKKTHPCVAVLVQEGELLVIHKLVPF